MIYRYKRHGGSFKDTTSLDVLYCFIYDSILEDDMWDYECEFHDHLNDNFGPATLEIRDFLVRDGEIVCKNFDYANWLQEYYEEEYEAWYKDWLYDYAETEANEFVAEVECTDPMDTAIRHGITVLVLEEYQDVDD